MGKSQNGAIGTALPPFTLKDTQGKTVHSEQFAGHPVLIDFWATWCLPCRQAAPSVAALYRDYSAKGVLILSVNLDDELSDVKRYLKRSPTSYPVVFLGDGTFAEDLHVGGIPAFLVIAPNGRIYQRYNGYAPGMEARWRKDLDALLK